VLPVGNWLVTLVLVVFMIFRQHLRRLAPVSRDFVSKQAVTKRMM